MITAHSGCDATADNSMAFVEHALRLPVEALEVDVRRNGCGELVLGHDEPAEDAVSLADVFRLLREYPEKKINCDMKQKDLEADVFALAQQCGVEKQLIYTGDVNPELFRKGQNHFPQVQWYANLEVLWPEFEQWKNSGVSSQEIDKGLTAVLVRMADYDTSGLNWYYSWAERIWEKARELSVGISVWTVNDPEEQKRWLGRCVENITTRRVQEILQIRNRG